MKKTLKDMLELNLQMFADDAADDGQADGEDTGAEDNTPNEDIDAEKIVEKLKKRLDSQTKAKHQAESDLQNALARIAELEKQSKESVKEKSDKEKEAEAQSAKDKEIADLKRQLRINQISEQADEVLKESNIILPKDMLGLLVDDDEEKTYSNVKTVISFLDSQQKEWEIKRNTRTTPAKHSNDNADYQNPFSDEHWNLTEQGRLYQEDPNKYEALKALANKQ